jgi:hypothetical protein
MGGVFTVVCEHFGAALRTPNIRVSGCTAVGVCFAKRAVPVDYGRLTIRRRAGGFNTGWIVS